MIRFSISFIEELIEDNIFSKDMTAVAEILLLAINDWPEMVEDAYDYELKIQTFIQNITTKKNIELAIDNIDFSKYAWQAESMSILLDVYNFFKDNVSLKEIIDRLKLRSIDNRTEC